MDGGNSPCPVLKPAYFPTRSGQSVRQTKAKKGQCKRMNNPQLKHGNAYTQSQTSSRIILRAREGERRKNKVVDGEGVIWSLCPSVIICIGFGFSSTDVVGARVDRVPLFNVDFLFKNANNEFSDSCLFRPFIFLAIPSCVTVAVAFYYYFLS